MKAAAKNAAVALLLWLLGESVFFFSGSELERPAFPSGFASGRLRSPPAASVLLAHSGDARLPSGLRERARLLFRLYRAEASAARFQWI